MTAHQSITFSRVGALALAGLVAASICIALWMTIPGPLLAHDVRIRGLRAEIVKIEKQRARLGELSRWVTARDKALSARSDFLSEGAGSSAAAMMQGAMRKAATEAGLSVISTQDYAPGLVQASAAGVRMNVAGDLNALTEFLVGLAEGSPRLLVDELAIRRSSGQNDDGGYSATVGAVAIYWSEGASS